MAVAKKVVKKSAAPVKAATKKSPAKKVAKAVEATPVKKGPGRPPGPIHVPEWIDVMKTSHHGRLGAKPGFGSAHLKAGDDGAVALQILCGLIEAKDPRLVKLLKAPKE
jgi:hypothetical protein